MNQILVKTIEKNVNELFVNPKENYVPTMYLKEARYIGYEAPGIINRKVRGHRWSTNQASRC